MVLAGRGFGKTRVGAEYVRARVEANAVQRIALIAATAGDARETLVEGQSGLLAISPPWSRPKYEPSKRRVTWPNGARATLFSADEPERLRGPEHDLIWADELAAWRDPLAWDMAALGLRLGRDPRAIVTTTPKPRAFLKAVLKEPGVIVTRGRTLDNAANLAAPFLEKILAKYAGTRLGRQELEAELLEDTPGALWTLAMFDHPGFRVDAAPPMTRVVVAVDPAETSSESSDETGIITAGLGHDGRPYVLADRSLRASPFGWATAAVRAYYEFGADAIIAERNAGGDMIETTIHTVDANVNVKTVWASRGKATRAEPAAALYEQNRVSHVGPHPELEAQLTGWAPGPGVKSPDRLDALVWALTELALGPQQQFFISRA